MTDYVLYISAGDGITLARADEDPSFESQPEITLAFSLANVLDSDVDLMVGLKQIGMAPQFSQHVLDLKFVDFSTNDVVYSVSGVLVDDHNNISSIVAVLEALDDFENVSLELADDDEEAIDELSTQTYYNKLNSDGRKVEVVAIPSGDAGTVPDLYDLVTGQDDLPTVMYMQFNGNVQQFTDSVRIAERLGVRLLVELDPDLTLEQAGQIAADLAPFNHHAFLLWSPILARPANSVGLKGRKVPRHAGGVLLAEYLKRQANTNSSGIPAIHRPIAGFDYPINFVGIQQNPKVVLNDPALKALAEVQLNVVKRERFPNGIRFIVNDCLTAYGDNQSVLKLANASEISMFIDNRLKEICKRHMLKDMDGTLEDTEKECKRLLDACTTKERPLLRKSAELGGFYTLKLSARDDRPHDAIDLECAYRPQGAGRAIYLKTTVTS